METSSATERTLPFTNFSEPRDLWWHRLPRSNYLPPIYAGLSDLEWLVLRDWFEETTRENLVGECGVPLMSFLHGLVCGNGIHRMVQLGTAAGYSAMLLGFFLRQMHVQHGLYSLEIDPSLNQFASGWIERAGLGEVVRLDLRSSLDPDAVPLATEYLGGQPELIFIDSSHEYGQTAQELERWYPQLTPGGLLVLHDTSEFAGGFDVTGHGGVRQALADWRKSHPEAGVLSLNSHVREQKTAGMIYQDFCGVGLIQKPA